MNEPLERLHTAAADLLSRVDQTLARYGAPQEHPIWPLLRRRALLPSDAVANVVAWSPQPLYAAAQAIHRHHEAGEKVRASLTAPSTWEGPAAEAASARIGAVRQRHEAFHHNAQALTAALSDLAAWFDEARQRLARVLARVLASAEAVTLTTRLRAAETAEHTQVALAAADIAAAILAEIDRLWTGALDLIRDHLARLESLDTKASGALPGGGTLRVEL